MSTSLDALIALPTTMMWRGLWEVTEQYVKNEVVVSPLDNRTYILIDTASLDGLDPSLNPAWYVFTGLGGAGINTLQTGTGITNVGSNTNPILQNSGVIEVKQGTGGISITGTPNNPIINCLGISTFNQGLGILINGNEIINDGIRHIGVGGGLVISGLFDKTLNTNGIISITEGSGISNIGTAQSPILDNIGVTQLTTPVGGLTLSGTTGSITCSNNGVLTLTAGTNITIVGNTISTPAPILCKLFDSITSSSGFPIVKPNSQNGIINFTVTSSFFNSCMLNGAPDPNGMFAIDLSSISFYTYGDTILSTLSLIIIALDSTTNTSVQIGNNRSYPFNPVAFYPTIGTINITVSQLRAAGLRSLTGLRFSTINATYLLTSTGPVTAVYFPNKN